MQEQQRYRKKGFWSLRALAIRERLRFLRLRVGLYKKPERGEVVRAENFGAALAKIAACRRFSKYVEIGTATGLGSTKTIMDELLARPDECRLWTIESVRFMHTCAVENWRGIDTRGRLALIYGAATPASEMMTWEEAAAEPHAAPLLHAYEKNRITHAESPDAKPHLPTEIDVLILDGGEFSSYGEFKALGKKAKVICLDDSHRAVKNCRVREDLAASDEWRALADRPDERNGWSIFCRKDLFEFMRPIMPPLGADATQ